MAIGKRTAPGPDAEVTTVEAASYLNIRADNFRMILSRGKGPKFIKRFGRNYFKVSDLDAWIAENSVEVPAYTPSGEVMVPHLEVASTDAKKNKNKKEARPPKLKGGSPAQKSNKR